MADDPNAAINDALRQSAHAAEIRARRQPPEGGNDKLDALRNEVRDLKQAFAGLTIQNGNCMRFSGSGRNITGAWEPPAAAPINPAGETAASFPTEAGVGDMLYFDGDAWIVLAAPSAPGDPLDNPVLRHDGTAPYWDEPEACP